MGIQNFEWGSMPPLSYTWVRPCTGFWDDLCLHPPREGFQGVAETTTSCRREFFYSLFRLLQCIFWFAEAAPTSSSQFKGLLGLSGSNDTSSVNGSDPFGRFSCSLVWF
jgi:hypothetical protein